MKQVKAALAACLLAGALTILFLSGSLPALAAGGPTPDFPIHLNCGDIYWASYADYDNGVLTVDYSIGNGGSVMAYNVTMQATATGGVTPATAIPIWMGDMAPGSPWNIVNFKWNVPEGVRAFRTDISICAGCDGTICVGEVLEAGGDGGTGGGINIKPGSCPNSINLNKRGDIAVAVYSYGSFDARTLDPNSVVFAGVAPRSWDDTENVDGKGEVDMVFHFRASDFLLEAGDTRACLSASITGGGTFDSCDMVSIVRE